MTEENKHDASEGKNEGFDLQDAQNMTVGEAARKESEIKAGVTEDDSVLDKYIKQHRDEVASQKFETKVSDLNDLDTETLDNFIHKQRQELERTGFLDEDVKQSLDESDATKGDDSSFDTVEQPIISEARPSQDQTFDSAETIVAPAITQEMLSAAESDSESDKPSGDSIALDDSDDNNGTPIYKNKRLIIGALAALIAVIFVVAYGLKIWNQSSSTASSSSSSSSEITSSSSATQAQEDFDDLYASFFVDDDQTQLKNSAFDSLSDLKSSLKKLEGTDYYDEAKTKYDSLAAQIEAVQAVNSLFDSDIISDGKLTSATVKSDADFDSLSSDVLSTGNAKLDTLIQSAISEGRSQLTSLAEAASSSSAAAASSSTNSQTESAATSSDNTNSSSTGTATTVSGATGYGITNYDSSTLQRSLSRVPYSESAIADSSNSAWTFTEGVLETIVATANARGYFSGNDYILEKVNIINGNGYYNMFKSDGTYLFSINCKTGYYVGNASGNADDLDY